jgi:hypothetical protein
LVPASPNASDNGTMKAIDFFDQLEIYPGAFAAVISLKKNERTSLAHRFKNHTLPKDTPENGYSVL